MKSMSKRNKNKNNSRKTAKVFWHFTKIISMQNRRAKINEKQNWNYKLVQKKVWLIWKINGLFHCIRTIMYIFLFILNYFFFIHFECCFFLFNFFGIFSGSWFCVTVKIRSFPFSVYLNLWINKMCVSVVDGRVRCAHLDLWHVYKKQSRKTSAGKTIL